MSRYHRRSRFRYSHHSTGRARALQHIEEARRLTQELGGTDEDVKQYFFSLPPNELQEILVEYGRLHGEAARQYAEETLEKWRSGHVKMSGMVAERLFRLLPPRMPLSEKYRLIENLWTHVGPSSNKVIRIGLDASLDDVLAAVRTHIEQIVIQYRIPENLERRFDWLASGDSQTKQSLLNYFREKEKELVELGAREYVPALMDHLRSEQGKRTHHVAQILHVGKHKLELRIDKESSGVAVVEPYAIKPNKGGESDWTWVIWILGGLAVATLLFSL